MSVIRPLLTIACLASSASPMLTRPADAQTADYFRALVVPPRSVGTCLPTDTSHAAVHGPLTNIHLVMVSAPTPPESRRQMMVVIDRTGRTVGYTDMVDVSTSLRSGTGDDVIAGIDSLGLVRGWRWHITTHLPDSISLGTSRASDTRAFKEHMIKTSSRDTLSTSAKRQVLQLAKWLRGRCPA